MGGAGLSAPVIQRVSKKCFQAQTLLVSLSLVQFGCIKKNLRLESVCNVTLFTSAHEQTQLNRCFYVFCALFVGERSFFVGHL